MKKKRASPSLNQPALIPPLFMERMANLLGGDYPHFAAIYEASPTHGLRVNTLKLSPSQFESFSPFPLTPIPYCPAGFLVSDEHRPGKHPYHAAGLYYLQDPHAQAVGEVLAPQPGERVLDLAAAPGGKTTHLASLMQNQGLLVANEIKTSRVGHLAANLERWGARNVAITNETPERLAAFFGPFFDRVLVDAPCSGEGMFRKDPSARLAWSPEMVAGCALRQKAILNIAARLVRPGGYLCYSTCTFAPEEDEEVAKRFLEANPNFQLAAEAKPIAGAQVTSHGLRLWPHGSPGEGHYIVLFQRADAGRAESKARAPFTPPSLPRHVQALWQSWCAENLTRPLGITPSQVGSRLYALPSDMPDLSGLRVLHPGWWLGNLKVERFEPSHALAMGLRSHEARQVAAFAADSDEVQRYLQGQALVSPGKLGWTLVTILPPSVSSRPEEEGFPLGWAKGVQGLLKNHYPRAFVWM